MSTPSPPPVENEGRYSINKLIGRDNGRLIITLVEKRSAVVAEMRRNEYLTRTTRLQLDQLRALVAMMKTNRATSIGGYMRDKVEAAIQELTAQVIHHDNEVIHFTKESKRLSDDIHYASDVFVEGLAVSLARADLL